MPMAATKISRFFIFFTALLFDKRSPGDKAKDTRTTTGQVTRSELTSNLNNFLPGLMKSGNQLARPTKQTGKTVRQKKQHQPAQQPRDQLSKGILRKKTLPPIQTSGGKPVQGHGPVAIN
jgi:hypothetical protein